MVIITDPYLHIALTICIQFERPKNRVNRADSTVYQSFTGAGLDDVKSYVELRFLVFKV